MAKLEYNESGKLVKGVFFEVSACSERQLEDYGYKDQENWIFVGRSPPRDSEWVWAQSSEGKGIPQYDCRADPTHETSVWHEKPHVDLFGGPHVSDAITDIGQFNLVTASFAQRLAKSGISGLRIIEPAVVNQSSVRDLEVRYLEFVGKDCTRARVITGGPNACPFCGKSPIICTECAETEYWCSRCGKRCIFVTEREHVLEIEQATPPARLVLDARRWDGSDFFKCGSRRFATKRAVDWLLASHVAPFQAEPSRVCVDGVTPEQMKKLEAAQRHV